MDSEIKTVISVILGMLLLIFSLFVSYRFCQTQPSGNIIPAGATYLGPSITPPK